MFVFKAVGGEKVILMQVIMKFITKLNLLLIYPKNLSEGPSRLRFTVTSLKVEKFGIMIQSAMQHSQSSMIYC